MESAERYRQYAQDCRRLAEKAAPKDKAVLLEIAAAWDQFADFGSKSKALTDGKDQSDVNAAK